MHRNNPCPWLTRRLVRVGLVVGLTAAALPASSAAKGVRLDPTFGNGRGWVTTSLPGGSSVAYAATVIAGGKTVIVGQWIPPSGNGQVLVVRYLRNGRVDRSFGSGGIFRTSLPTADGPFIGLAVAQERSTGRMLVAGGYGLGSILVLRLTPNGRLDRSFGPKRTGLATAPVGGTGESLVIQRNGGILVGSSNENQNGRPMVVVRFTRNGAIDRRFGSRGVAQALFWNPNLTSSAGASSLASTPDGGVIASGHLDYIGGDGHGTAGVFRLSASGRPVRGFGSGGHVEIGFKNTSGGGNAQWFPCAMTADSRGRTTVTGDGSTGPGAALLSARLTLSGRLDPSFGKAGRSVVQGLLDSGDTTCGAARTAAGGLTVGVGHTLAALVSNGAADSRFARGGIIRITKPAQVGINALARSGSCSVVVAGSAGNDLYVARYLLPTR